MAKEESRINNLENRMSVIEQKVNGIDEKMDTVLNKLNGFMESGVNLKHLEKEFEKNCIRNEEQHKNFISKVGFYTVSSLLGIIIIVITVINFLVGK